jgi:hypothetical protein
MGADRVHPTLNFAFRTLFLAAVIMLVDIGFESRTATAGGRVIVVGGPLHRSFSERPGRRLRAKPNENAADQFFFQDYQEED